MTKSNDIKNALSRVGSAFCIIFGLYDTIHSFELNIYWELLLSSILFLLGLDWRFNQHKVMADITIRKQVERDPDMEFTKHE